MIMVHESRNRRTVNAIFSESWIINLILNLFVYFGTRTS